MSHRIYDEQKLFAYRKLIELLNNGSVSFFTDQLTDKGLVDQLGIYEKNLLLIIFGLYDFWENDVRDGLLKVSLVNQEESELFSDIEYLISIYNQQKRGVSLLVNDPLTEITEKYHQALAKNRTSDPKVIQKTLILLVRLAESGLENVVYNTDLTLVIDKCESSKDILHEGVFSRNIYSLYQKFHRSDFGNEGNYLLSFPKQCELTRDFLRQQFDYQGVSDIVISPQAQFSKRTDLNDKSNYIFSPRIRLLDCLFYLEQEGEICITELLPGRIVVDASNLSLEEKSILSEEVILNGFLKLVPEERWINVVLRDTDEKVYEFIKTDSQRLKIFRAIASKYPNHVSREQIANSLNSKKHQDTTKGIFYKEYVYNPVSRLGKELRDKTKGYYQLILEKPHRLDIYWLSTL